jgi:hypothetical protein
VIPEDEYQGLLDRVAALEQAISLGRTEDPWMNGPASAKYLGVSLGHLHNLVSEGLLSRNGDKGDRLYFRRSQLDAYAEGR